MDIKCEFKELVDIVKVVPNPKNPNKHSDKQIDLLQRLIKHQGWRHPIIVSNRSGFVCAGHGRLQAAIKMGLKQVPVDYQDFDSEAQEYQFMVSDNTIQEMAELDLAMVNTDVLDFGPDFDLDMLGIPDFNLAFEKKNNDSNSEQSTQNDEAQFIVAVTLENELEMQEFYEDCLLRGYKCKLIT